MALHNFLILMINAQRIRSLPYCGVVVDLGCGNSSYKDDIVKKSQQYIGVDWPNCQHNQKSIDIFADLNLYLPFRTNRVDTVVSFEVLEHLSEPQSFLHEACRILKPGGQLFVSVPFQWQIHEAPYDCYRYTKYGLEYILKKSGFSDIVITSKTGFWLTWFLKFNYHSLRFIKGPMFVRWLIRAMLIPVWIINQLAGTVLDKFDRDESETAGYTARAVKR